MVNKQDTPGSLRSVTGHSIFSTTTALLQQFNHIQNNTGTRIVIYNLRKFVDHFCYILPYCFISLSDVKLASVLSPLHTTVFMAQFTGHVYGPWARLSKITPCLPPCPHVGGVILVTRVHGPCTRAMYMGCEHGCHFRYPWSWPMYTGHVHG